MMEMRKVTAILPRRELEMAMKATGLGINDVLREVLELYVRRAEEARRHPETGRRLAP